MASLPPDNENVVNNIVVINSNISAIDGRDDSNIQSKTLKLGLNSKNLLTPKIQLQNEKDGPVEELLGSVTTFNNSQGGSEQALRTSARVIKKLQQDSMVSVTVDKDKKESKSGDKTENKPKPKLPKASWSVIEKNLFFEALNEFGKDFESVTQYISSKMKRRGVCDNLLKTKDQVRHFYYRTWNKISKFITFNTNLKKVVQELYLLINYGEMRKKIFLINEKTALKLSELIYRGSVPLRMKGKTFRIKTPMCRALRKLNEMEEWQEELKLPTRVLVVLQPSNVEAWHRVQSVAHNPRVSALIPIQRRLSNLLSILNERWKTYDTKLLEKLADVDKCAFTHKNSSNPKLLHFGPKAGVHINKPIINLSEYITSNRICLNSYEERLGITEKSETIFSRTIQNFKGGTKKGAKRQRSESGGEKKNLDILTNENISKKAKLENESVDDKLKIPSETTTENEQTIASVDLSKDILNSNGDIDTILKEDLQELKSENNLVTTSQKSDTKPKTKDKIKIVRKKIQSTENKSLDKETENKIQDIFKYGWTIDDAANVTFGDLYLMFGSNSKIQMEYWWDCVNKSPSEESKSEAKIIKSDNNLCKDSENPEFLDDPKDQNENISKKSNEVFENSDVHLLLPHKTEISTNIDVLDNESKQIEKTTDLTRRLKQLLLCLQTNEKTKKSSCVCGHVCNEKLIAKSNTNKQLPMDLNNEIYQTNNITSQRTVSSTMRDNSVFRQPFPISSDAVDNFEKQINSLMKIKPRWDNRQNRYIRTKQVVQRMLPLVPNASAGSYINLNYTSLNTSNFGQQTRTVASRQLNFGADAEQSYNRKLDSKIITNETKRSSNLSTNPNIAKQNFNKPKLGNKQITSTIVKAECKPMETIVKNTLMNEEVHEKNDSDLIDDDFSIGSSTIAEARASIIKNDQISELLDSSRVSDSLNTSCILNTPENTWFNSDLHDFSLSSFLGHLESPVKPQAANLEETKICQDVDVNMQSLLNENSEDYMAKFAALAARISSENSNK